MGLFFAPAANAAINCIPVPSTLTTYPFVTHAFYCRNTITGGGAPTQSGSGMAGTINDMNGAIGPAITGYEKLRDSQYPTAPGVNALPPLQNSGVPFFIFDNIHDANAYLVQESAAFAMVRNAFGAIGNGTFGNTYIVENYNSGAIPTTVPLGRTFATFIILNEGGGIPINRYLNVNWVTAHEAGHTIDAQLRTLSGQGATPDSVYFSQSAMFNAILQNDIDNINHKRVRFCSTRNGPGIFSGRRSFGTEDLICSSTRGIDVRGTPVVGDQVAIKIEDPLLPGGFLYLNFTVASTNPTQVATAIKLQINANPDLKLYDITATSSGASIDIDSPTGNQTVISKTAGQLNLNFTMGTMGGGPNLTFRYSGKTNFEVLKIAYPNQFADNAEFFANEVAEANGLSTPGPYGLATYFNEFPCTMYLTRQVINQGTLPTQNVFKAIVGRPGDNKKAGCPFKSRPSDPVQWALPN